MPASGWASNGLLCISRGSVISATSYLSRERPAARIFERRKLSMNNIFHPKAHFNNIYEITPNYLKYKGISCVILDIDNTLVPYSVRTPDNKLAGWIADLVGSGIKIAVVSNARVLRADEFVKSIKLPESEALDIITVGKAKKPFAGGFKIVEEKSGLSRDKMCIIGDQIFTDVLGGNLSGVFSIWVTPMENKEPAFVRFKRIFEKPVIFGYNRKFKHKGQKNVGLLGLIGHPVGHSISPLIQNTLNEAAGYNFYYDKFDVAPENLERDFNDLKNKGFKGLNVTVPYKEDVMKYLDVIDEEAAKAGAVNTVVFKNNKAYGYNTDINGFAMSVQDGGRPNRFEDAKVLILGAGGGARGVALACLKNGAKQIDFTNRTFSKAKELAEMFNGDGRFKCEPCPHLKLFAHAAGDGVYKRGSGGLRPELTAHISCEAVPADENFSKKFKEYDIIINTTSAGMKPQEDMLPVETGFEFRKGQLCYDIIYNPEKTLLLQKAEREGADIMNGRGMLFWQGLESFNIWAAASDCKELTKEQINKVKDMLNI